jgi:phage terminase large subunit-like protein
MTPTKRSSFLQKIEDSAIRAVPWMFEIWALPHQKEPDGDWDTWVILGGRGAGKTRAGAEWVRDLVEGATPLSKGAYSRVALIGETIEQAREVMVFGDSGILACSPPDRKPIWNATRKCLTWPNGAEAWVMSAHNSEALRGPQFDAAWLDEMAKWKNAQEAWDMLQFTLRLGHDPRTLVTTTPRNQRLLKELLKDEGTKITHAPTQANWMHLAPKFVERIIAKYGNSRTGRQEIEGVLLTDVENALWTSDQLDQCRVEQARELDRIVVAVDPPASSGERADACGIVVAGACTQGPVRDWRAIVLADLTLKQARPHKWAQAVLWAYQHYQADRVVAEVNQGGEMVEAVLRQQSELLPYRSLRASKGKIARAEPVSALYEQGKVSHCGDLRALEDQMCEMTLSGFVGSGSPDRVDALVWALTDLMIEPANKRTEPHIRGLY